MNRLEAKDVAVRRAVALLVVLGGLEVVAVFLAYETIGEVASGLYWLPVMVTAGLLAIVRRRPRTAATIGVLVAALVLPQQARLGYRLLELRREVTAIVAFAEGRHSATGSFPTDLSGYQPRNADVMRFVQGYVVRDAGQSFSVTFYVGTPNTSHWYSSVSGWGYYPD